MRRGPRPLAAAATPMELLWLGAAVALLGAAWFLAPYLDWRDTCGRPLDAHVARTSFPCAPGELVPPAWKAPEVTLSVIVPAYNEEYRLPQMLDETLTYLEQRARASTTRFTYEVIVVDDGSRDGTYAAALGSRPREPSQTSGELRVMQLTANRGKGFAVRAGMLAARGQLLLMADADGATKIGDLERLELALAPRQDGTATEIAFGSRHHLKEEAIAKRSWYRNILMVCFHLVVALLVGGSVHDTQCGFKLFRADVGKRIFASLHLYRWAFDIEVVILARLLGKSLAEVPVTWVEMPGSKLNLITGSLTMLRDIVVVQVFYFLGVWSPSFTC